MKNAKTKIILSAIISLSVVGFAGTAFAADSSVYISPASLTKNTGETFVVSAGVNTSANKVCAVEGTVVFNNLSCQSITLASGVNPQSTPTCSNPYFLIGVPGCTTADKVLFTVLTKAGSVGVASVSFTGVDVIGEGVSVGTASVSGNYTINAIPVPTPTPTATPTPTPTPVSATFEKSEEASVTVSSEEGEETDATLVEQSDEQQPIEQPVEQAEDKSLLAYVAGGITSGVSLAILVGLAGLIAGLFIWRKVRLAKP